LNSNVKIYCSVTVKIAIEPHSHLSHSKSWIQPTISRVIYGTLRIPNLNNEPVQIPKSQHVAQIRPVIVPVESLNPSNFREHPSTNNHCPTDFSSAISIDPDGILSSKSRSNFREMSERFTSVFNPDFGVYNDKSGLIRADINLGPVEPPTQKGKLPSITNQIYNFCRKKLTNLKR